MRLLLIGVLSGMVLPAAAYAFPPEYANALRTAAYTLLSGDYNSDGRTDLLAVAERRTSLIALAPNSPSFMLLSSGSGYELVPSPSSSVLSSSVWQPANYEIAYADVEANGSAAMFLRGRTAGSPAFTIVTSSSNGEPVLLQTITAETLQIDLGASGTTTVLADWNSDGRADLEVRVNGTSKALFIADASGKFVRSEEGSIRAVWGGLMTALSNTSSDAALAYIADESLPKYQAAFQALGTEMKDLPPTFSDIEAVEITEKYARFVVFSTQDGSTRMHFIAFVKRGDSWLVAEF